MKVSDLPDFIEVSKKAIPVRTALENFIYHNEPAGVKDEIRFRKSLVLAINELRSDWEKSNG